MKLKKNQSKKSCKVKKYIIIKKIRFDWEKTKEWWNFQKKNKNCKTHLKNNNKNNVNQIWWLKISIGGEIKKKT